jgi:hypothetical protein
LPTILEPAVHDKAFSSSDEQPSQHTWAIHLQRYPGNDDRARDAAGHQDQSRRLWPHEGWRSGLADRLAHWPAAEASGVGGPPVKLIVIRNAALLFAPLLWANTAAAHGIAGNQYFAGAMTFDDPTDLSYLGYPISLSSREDIYDPPMGI